MNKREQLDRTADRVRDELLVTLRELDRRRGDLTSVGYHAQRHQGALAVLGIAVTGLIGAAFGYTAYRARSAERHRMKRRLTALQRAWHHPERLAVKSEDRPLPAELIKKLGLAFGIAFGSQLAKRAAQSLIPVRT